MSKRKPVRVKITRKEYLGTLIRLTERAISKNGDSIDDYLINQAVRLKEERKKK